jgi:NADPH:quinone reductase
MPTIPKTMKGVIVEKTGGIEVLEYKTDLPVPEPKEGEILVKNDFIGVNYIDTSVLSLSSQSLPFQPRPALLTFLYIHSYFRSGLYQSPKPEVLGCDAEGTVVATGPGETYNIHPGDRVVYLGASTYAEYTAAPSLRVHVIPPALAPGVAVAALFQGLTALTLIRESHPIA